MKLPSINATNILAKTTGIVALGMIAYDSHCAGRVEAEKNEKDIKTDSLEKHFFDDMKQDSASVIERNVKKRIFDFHMDEGISGFFTNIAGYAKGFSSMLVDNVIPLALAAGTMVGSKGGSHIISKFSAAGLVAYGAVALAKDFFGIGNSHDRVLPE